MIVQTALAGTPHFVILQTDHARMSGLIAEAFGNGDFAAPDPYAPMIYVAAHHDDGWLPIDAQVVMDPATGLPYHLGQTPFQFLLQTSAGSPAVNERYHPYSGMMSSMHTVGLFHGRYVLSDKVAIDTVPAEFWLAAQTMLAAELERQEQLKDRLFADPETAVFVRDKELYHNYKLLQFFDTLALYFQMTHEEARGDSYFENVPQAVGKDVTITIKRMEAGVYALSPYPFYEDRLALSYRAYPMMPQALGTDLQKIMAELEPITETVILIPG